MAFNVLSPEAVALITAALSPRFLGRDQNHLLALADVAAEAGFDRAYDYIEPLTGRVGDLELYDDTQDSRMSAIETVNGTQTTRLNGIDTLNTTQNDRLTAAEGVNTTQNTNISTLQGQVDPTLRTDLAATGAGKGTNIVGFIASGTGAVARTGQSKLRDYVSVKDFGAVGDGTTDDTAAIQLAVTAAAAAGRGIQLPVGNFKMTATVTSSTFVPVLGLSESLSKLTFTHNGPCFEYNNSIIGVYGTSGQLTIVGPGVPGTNTSACFMRWVGSAGLAFCRFQNITATSLYTVFKSDIPAILGGAGYRGDINWCTFQEINTRATVKHGIIFNQGSGTGNAWIGGKPSIGVAGGSVIEALGPTDASRGGLGVNVGDIVIANVHCISETGETPGSHTSALLRVGPDTTYRSRIGLYGCQFDAQMDKPLDLSTTGSTTYSDIRVIGDNIGGNVNFYDNMPPIANSMIIDQSYGQWKANFTGSTATTTAYTDEVFKIDLKQSTGCMVDIVVDGVVGSAGSCVGVWKYLIRAGIGTLTVTEVSENVSGATAPARFDITNTTSGNVVTFSVGFTSGGGTTNYTCNLAAVGGTIRVQNGKRF
jgi:hypothetical protein